MQHRDSALRLAILALACVASAPGWAAPKAPDHRTIAFYNIHTKDKLSVTYRRNGRYVPEALEKINWMLRDWRKNKIIKIDPKLIDLAWEIHTELGSKKPIHVISGYRSPATNAMLRKTRGGQAKRSQHMLGHALDLHFPDVPIRRMRYSALIRQQGGVGYYPTSAIPFVHIDTARVRHWPRMNRDELALLFPNAKTKHRPAKGGPITLADVRKARESRPNLAQRVAAFRAHRQPLDAPRTQIAALSQGPKLAPFQTSVTRAPEPPQPKPALTIASLIRQPERAIRPRPRARPEPPTTLAAYTPEKKKPAASLAGPTPQERSTLSRWAALASATFFRAAFGIEPAPKAPPEQVAGARLAPDRERKATDNTRRRTPYGETAWVTAAAYDDEHPEELSYRPFPILPLLEAASDDKMPMLEPLATPDAALTLQVLDEIDPNPLMRWQNGGQPDAARIATVFTGRAVSVAGLEAMRPFGKDTTAPLRGRILAAAQ